MTHAVFAAYGKNVTVSWRELASALAARLEPAGFEVFGAVDTAAYNAALDASLRDYALPQLGEGAAVALVVGNTRRLWPLFLQAYASTALSEELHPLDMYSRANIGAAAAHVSTTLGVRHTLRYSFDPVPNTVAIQRLAALAGVAEIAPVGLCIHPEHGPWLSLRAAVVFDVPGPEASAARATCSSCTTRPCLSARERVAELCKDTGFTRESFHTHWQAWLAMREACPVGHDARYGAQQVRYHYLKQLDTLRE